MKTLLLATACVLSSPFFSQSILPEGNSAVSQTRQQQTLSAYWTALLISVTGTAAAMTGILPSNR